MVLWRATSSFAVLLRIARHPSTCAAPRTVVSTSPSFTIPKKPPPSTHVPQDDEEHDPDIDLITLRRKTKPSNESTTSNSEGTSSVSSINVASGEATDDTPAQPGNDPQPDSNPSKESSSGTERSDDQTHTSESAPADTTGGTGHKFRKPERLWGIRRTDLLDNLDQYLEHYLKTLPPKSPAQAKRQIISERSSNRHDRDVEFLHPSDIRNTYNLKQHSSGFNENPFKVATLPEEPGVITDNIVDAGIARLKLPSFGDRVVIPRSVLMRLIEQTITLSGAAVNGEDVVIERYSPTWHRFARLLRTSDLDKISALAKPNRAVARFPKELESESSLSSAAITEEGKLSEAQLLNPTIGITGDDHVEVSKKNTEREYVILALDSKKKRVASTRFRRLLDGAPHVIAPSSDSLLKVEKLGRYLPHLKPLESEGFHIAAASETGIVLSRSLEIPDVESDNGTGNRGWLRSILKRT